ncbi:MAG: DedA family protein, partial [Patescibacteria group bacterium]
GFLWAVGLSLAGYFLGSLIPNIDRFLIPIILLIIALTSLPGIIHVLANPTTRTAIWKFIKKIPQ